MFWVRRRKFNKLQNQYDKLWKEHIALVSAAAELNREYLQFREEFMNYRKRFDTIDKVSEGNVIKLERKTE